MSNEVNCCYTDFESDPNGSMMCTEELQQRPTNETIRTNGTVKKFTDNQGNLHFNLAKMFTSETSAHGFKCAFSRDRSKILRSLWTLAIVIAVVSLFAALFELWDSYHKYPVKTIIDLKHASELPFPSVTLCNLHSIHCRKGEFLPNVTDGGEKLCNIFAMDTFFSHKQNDYLSDPDYQDILMLPAIEIYKTVTVRMDEMIRYCSWGNVRVPCQTVFKEVNTLDGNCFTFNYNSSHPLVTSSVGPVSGLSVLAFQSQEDTHLLSAGLKILLHSPGTYPNTLNHGFLIPPGFSTYGRIHVRETTHLPYPYTSFGGNYCKETHGNHSGYNRDSCIGRCAYRLAVRECNCTVPIEEPTELDDTMCTLRQAFTCMHSTIENIIRTAARDKTLCPVCDYSCHTTTYSLSTSHAIFPALNHEEMIIGKKYQKTEENNNRANYLELRLFYDQLTIESIHYEPEFNWHSMLGIVGGQMGFFIGASLLTVLEMLEFLFLLAGLFVTKGIKRLWPKKEAVNEQDIGNF